MKRQLAPRREPAAREQLITLAADGCGREG